MTSLSLAASSAFSCADVVNPTNATENDRLQVLHTRAIGLPVRHEASGGLELAEAIRFSYSDALMRILTLT